VRRDTHPAHPLGGQEAQGSPGREAQIAARAFISEATVKTHINRIFAKTGSRDRAQAIAYAHCHHITPAREPHQPGEP